MPLITFLPAGTVITASDGETLFVAAQRAGLSIPTACVGRGSCALCRVKVMSGEAHLSPINDVEKKHLGNTYFITRLRLSCQTIASGGDVTVRIPDARPKPRGP